MFKTNELKAARARAGVTQAELAKKIGMCVPAFSIRENGKREFTVSEVNDIAKVLRLSQADVVKIFFA